MAGRPEVDYFESDPGFPYIASLSIPDSDRNWFTVGLGYNFLSNSTLDFALAFIRGQEVDVTEEATGGESVSATTLSNGVYYSMQYSYAF